MNATELIWTLAEMGIRLVAHGDRLRYWPRSAVTPDLFESMRAHKTEVLAILRRESSGSQLRDAAAIWHAALDRLEGDSQFPPEVLETLRAADVRWAVGELPDEPLESPADDSVSETLAPDCWPTDSIDLDQLASCPQCGTLDLWQTMTGNWRCLRCDPPTGAWRMAELAEQIRREKHQRY